MIKRSVLAAVSILTLLQTNTAIANAEISLGVAQNRANFQVATESPTLDATVLTLTGRYHFSDHVSVGGRVLAGINDTDDSQFSGGLNRGYEVFVGTKYKLGNQFSIFGDTGLSFSEIDFVTPQTRSDKLILGAIFRGGLSYELTQRVNLNIDYTFFYNPQDSSQEAERTQTLGLSVGYKF